MRTACCPGTYDPVTNGHLDIITRTSAVFERVVVGVVNNPVRKETTLFTAEERIAMLERACAGFANVTVASFTGLLTDFCRAHDVDAIVKGLRAVSDFDYELKMAQMNHGLTGVDTLFMPTNPEFSFLSSSLVKEVATWGGDVGRLIPAAVLERLVARLDERR